MLEKIGLDFLTSFADGILGSFDEHCAESNNFVACLPRAVKRSPL
jgi:hypothetical protein